MGTPAAGGQVGGRVVIVHRVARHQHEISGRYISLRRSAVHKIHNSKLHIFLVIALCSFFIIEFCPEHNS